MICGGCRDAAAIITGAAPPCPGRAAELHEIECPGGTWCDCAHKMPPSYKGCGNGICAETGCVAEAAVQASEEYCVVHDRMLKRCATPAACRARMAQYGLYPSPPA